MAESFFQLYAFSFYLCTFAHYRDRMQNKPSKKGEYFFQFLLQNLEESKRDFGVEEKFQFKYQINQFMQKKAQQAKPPANNKLEPVEQQNEPFVRALQKKVRNINKKLVEITELETKENLKPEQIEKINRKQALIEEKARQEELTVFYVEFLKENALFYRTQQLKELENLAKAIVVHNFHNSEAPFPEAHKLNQVSHAVHQDDYQGTLSEAISTLANILKAFANDHSLQKKLNHYVEVNANIKEQSAKITHEKIVNDICEQKKEVVKQEQLVQEKAKPHQEPAQSHAVEAPPAVVASEQKAEIAVVAEQHPDQLAEKPKVELEKEEIPAKAEFAHYRPQSSHNKARADHPPNQYNRNNRTNKPRYTEKKPDGQANDDHERYFFEKLEEEGFTVVGKPKPKARDQKQFYDREHGRKYPHHRQQVDH